MAEQREIRTSFHLDKTVNISHIITTMSIVVSAIWWGSSVETRLAVQASHTEGLRGAVARMENEQDKNRTELYQKLDALNEKLDRLVESRMLYAPPGAGSRK